MGDSTTYDVRVYKTEVYKGATVTTYKVRWKTDHRPWKEGFRSAALADWTAPGILEALIPGRMQSHACTAEVP